MAQKLRALAAFFRRLGFLAPVWWFTTSVLGGSDFFVHQAYMQVKHTHTKTKT